MGVLGSEPLVDRFNTPLYTGAEAARLLGLAASTFRYWSRGVAGPPVVTALEDVAPGGAVIPFIGLAEGYALAAIRAAGVPLQRIRPALARVAEELGVEHALASERLATDGVEVLFDYQGGGAGSRELVVVRHGQRVLADVVTGHLQRMEYGPDGFAVAVPLPGLEPQQAVADARRSSGRPYVVSRRRPQR